MAGGIENLESLVGKLRDLAAKARKDTDVSVAVGYTANYALAVHEMIEGAPNPPKSDSQRKAMFASIREREKTGHKSWSTGGPKFLEAPARELNNNGTLSNIVVTAMRQGKTLAQSMLLAGLRLQRESQQRCPVDLGNLRASAYTVLE